MATKKDEVTIISWMGTNKTTRKKAIASYKWCLSFCDPNSTEAENYRKWIDMLVCGAKEIHE